MQARMALSSSPSLNSYCDVNQDQLAETAAKICEDLNAQLKLVATDDNRTEKFADGKISTDDEDQQRLASHDADDEEGDAVEDDDFSFVCNGADKSPISADDVFQNGQIRPIFPFFNQDLLFSDEDSEASDNRLHLRPPVRKVFIEAPPHPSSSTLSENDEIDGLAAGPYCAWSKKDTEASPDLCKKSNSTGFSKLWRFRDYLSRSNSDGRDAFVFLNDSTTTATSAKREEKVVEKSDTSLEKKTASEVKVNVAGGKVKAKKKVKGQTASLSAHEIYMRDRVLKEEGRRRSYLPYRTEVVGFFTNVNGGLSRNVHPF